MSEIAPKRILIFSTAYYPFVGGAEVSVKEITDRLDCHFDLITARMDKNLPRTEKIGRVNVYRIGFGKPLLDKLLLPFWGAKVALDLLRRPYDCFWGIMATYASGAAYLANITLAFRGRPQVPIVLTLQEGDSESHFQFKWAGLINLSWRMALRRTAYLTGLSSFLIHRAESFGYQGRRRLVPNGVDIDLFSRSFSEEEKNEIRQRIGKREDDTLLVTVSRLVRKNGVDTIISALSHLPDNVKLLVVGRGEEGSKLQKLAYSLGLKERVKFAGFVAHKDLPLHLAVSDIFVRPSRSEGFGNSFIEAMAARLPVIATPVGGIPDFLDDKETGFFCAPDSPESLAEAVREVLDSPARTAKVVENAKSRVSGRYDWDTVAREMSEVFEETIGNENSLSFQLGGDALKL